MDLLYWWSYHWSWFHRLIFFIRIRFDSIRQTNSHRNGITEYLFMFTFIYLINFLSASRKSNSVAVTGMCVRFCHWKILFITLCIQNVIAFVNTYTYEQKILFFFVQVMSKISHVMAILSMWKCILNARLGYCNWTEICLWN